MNSNKDAALVVAVVILYRVVVLWKQLEPELVLEEVQIIKDTIQVKLKFSLM